MWSQPVQPGSNLVEQCGAKLFTGTNLARADFLPFPRYERPSPTVHTHFTVQVHTVSRSGECKAKKAGPEIEGSGVFEQRIKKNCSDRGVASELVPVMFAK